MLKIVLGIFLFVYVSVLVVSYVSVIGNVDPNQGGKLQLNDKKTFLNEIQDQVDLKPEPKQTTEPKTGKNKKQSGDSSDQSVSSDDSPTMSSRRSELSESSDVQIHGSNKSLEPTDYSDYSPEPQQKNAVTPAKPFTSSGRSTRKTPNIDYAKANLMRMSNPFFLLGAYPEITDEHIPEFRYDEKNYFIQNDNSYCDKVDMAVLNNPQDFFDRKVFYTDFPKNQLPRKLVMSKTGSVPLMTKIKDPKTGKKTLHLNQDVNSFFMQFSIFHHYHKIGSNFLCASQMFNHIPGVESLVTKDQVVDKINTYIKRYEDRPKCFNKESLFPYTYRLYDEDECKSFFNKIHSPQYKASLKKEAIQFVIKVGHGSHKSEGVYLLDKNETDYMNKRYNNGRLCGIEDDSLLAQTYIGNPLLLNFNNKFDFRVYMLIASTNPLIVYYHDGFIKTSLFQYEKSSAERGTHITNTFLANQKIEEAKKKGERIYNMTEQELKEYILWDFEKLQTYLLESKKVSDPNWLNNYLRPAFHKAFIHLTRMTKDTYWKGSNVYALQGADFMLDENVNLWFIESNPSPLLSGTTKWMIYQDVVRDHFDIMFAYLRSRVKRALSVIEKMNHEIANGDNANYGKWREEFADAFKNRLEPEYSINKNNTWVKIVDENLPGPAAYMNYISAECL